MTSFTLLLTQHLEGRTGFMVKVIAVGTLDICGWSHGK